MMGFPDPNKESKQKKCYLPLFFKGCRSVAHETYVRGAVFLGFRGGGRCTNRHGGSTGIDSAGSGARQSVQRARTTGARAHADVIAGRVIRRVQGFQSFVCLLKLSRQILRILQKNQNIWIKA